MGDQHGFFQNTKPVQLEETEKVESQCVRHEEGMPLQDKGRIRERWVRFFTSLFFSFFPLVSLIADGPHHYHPACGHKGSSHLSPVTTFLSRCKFSTLTTRQPMVEFYLLTFPRFPLRKKEHKSYFGKNRTHDFRTSRCAAYLY